MFLLPKELVDYIYSFDDNIHYKKNYRFVMTELTDMFNKKCCHVFISRIHTYYDIYLIMCNYFPYMNLSQYVLRHAKNPNCNNTSLISQEWKTFGE